MLGDLIPGDLVGSALILSGIPSNVEALTVEPLRAMRWQIGTLDRGISAPTRKLETSCSGTSPMTSLEKSDVWLRNDQLALNTTISLR